MPDGNHPSSSGSGPPHGALGLLAGAILPFPADRKRIAELVELANSVSQGRPTRRIVARAAPRFENPGSLINAELVQPGGDRLSRQLCSFNVSTHGGCLIVPAYLHPSTHVSVRYLVPITGDELAASGEVRWCDLLRSPFHLAGVKWDEPIDVKPLVPAAVWAAAADQRSADVAIRGQALVFSEHAMDRSLVCMLLSDTDMEATEAQNTGEAIDLIRQCDFDVLLLDIDMDGMSPVELLELVRAAEYEGPMVAMSRDEAASSLAGSDNQFKTRFLAKPLEESSLHTSLRTLIQENGFRSAGSGPVASSLADRPQFAGYIDAYVNAAVEAASSMLELAEGDRTEELVTVLEQLAANSAGFGFRDVGERASKLIGLIRDRASAKDCRPGVRKFCEILLRLETVTPQRPDDMVA